MPQFKTKYNLLFVLLSLISIFLICSTACRHDSPWRIPPKADKGVLDLSDWDFKIDGPIDLSGDYEFYWMKRLSPSDFSKSLPPQKTGFIKVPGYWKDSEIEGMKYPGDGYATYRLKIILNKQRESLALRLLEISTAYILYIDGRNVASLGVPGNSLETTVPRQRYQVVDFESERSWIEIILQVSSFRHRRGGGPWEGIRLGTEKEIRGSYLNRLGLDLFLFGSIFIMALYHIGLFIVRKRDNSSLYFSVFCLLIALRLLTTGGRHLIHLFPNLSWEPVIKLEYLSFYLSVPAFGLFMHSLFQKFSKRIIQLLGLLGVAFSCIVIFTSPRFFSYTLNAYEIITLFTFIYGLYVIFASLPQMRIEAFAFLLGFVILFLAAINDMLHVEGFIHTRFLLPFGLFAFILSHAFIISYRFSKAHTTVETQQKELRDTLGSYKTEIIERFQAEEALRESEEKYRTILQSIEEAYYEVDLAGNLTFFNDSLCKQLGYSRDELMGMNNRQFMSAETAKRVYKTFSSVYETGKAAKAIDWEMIEKDGSKKIVELSVTLMRDAEGRPIGFRGVGRDITERKQAEEQAKIHQQQLMQASKMVALGTLVSGVAHEVNNPNNFIMLNSPILKEAWENALPILDKYYEENGDFLLGGMNYSELRDNTPKLFAGISDGAKRIKRIVDELKNYVRDNSADLNQSVDINEVLKSTVSLLSNMIKNSTNHFSIKYAKNLPSVKGNFQRLEQVMINIIQNACQALTDSQNGIFVTIKVDKKEPEIVVKVRDEGMGIPSEMLMNITDPFFTTKNDSGGVGLGLSISSKIIEEHGGRMHFKSEIGSGTTVEIKLPFD